MAAKFHRSLIKHSILSVQVSSRAVGRRHEGTVFDFLTHRINI